MDEEREGGMKIKDRRRFDQEGNPKEEGAQEASNPEGVSGTRPDATVQSSAAPSPADDEFVMRESSEGDDEGDVPIDYSSFLLSLATQAMVQLGEMPSPPGVNIPKNREAARHTIDVIAMLDQKTKGNLTEAERRLTEEILHNLRIGFVRSKP